MVDGLVHLRDCEVCECFSTLIGKIERKVIYMAEVESTRQTSQSRKVDQMSGSSLDLYSCG